MSGKSIFVIVLLILGFIQPAVLPAQAQDASWTIIYYSVSDTDLEDVQMLDFNEMEEVGSTSDVNIVMQIDRAAGHSDVDGDWTDTRRYLITQDPSGDWETTQSTLLESLGEVNMGDPAVLVDFVTWTIENYPAQKYALFLADHGAGWPGFGGDESTPDYDSFTMLELDGALSQIVEATGVTFEVIGFDACLMNQLEVNKMLAPYANYAYLAEETEPGFGWAYYIFLADLVNNPSMDGAELGQSVVDSYMHFYTTEITDYEQFDLSVIDLSKVSGVDAAMNAFVRAVQENAAEVMSAIGSARNNVQFFGSTNPDEADEISSIDLVHFLELLIRLSPNADVNAAAQDLIDAINDMIVYQQANPGLPNAHGMAIYFPRNQRIYTAFQSYQAYNYELQVPYMSDWTAFLKTFYGQTVAAVPPVEDAVQVVSILGVYPPGEVSIHKPPVVVFHFDGKEITEVSFSATLITEDGAQIMLDESPLEYVVYSEEDGEPINDFPEGPSESEFAWGAEMPIVTDETVMVPTLFIGNPNNPGTLSISGTYIPQDGGQTTTAYLSADLESWTVNKVWGSNETGGFAAPFEIKPKPGDEFLPTWRFLNENKEYELVPANSDPLTFGDSPFRIDYEPAPTGSYIFTIRVEDIAGNLYSDSVVIQVNNEGLDTGWRGFTDISLGVNFLYPWDWPEPYTARTEDGDEYVIIPDEDEEINIYVNAYEGVESPEEIADLLQEYVEGLADTQLEEMEEATAGGYDAMIAYYQSYYEDVELMGAALGVLVPENGTAYIIDFDAPVELEDQAYEVFQKVYETVNFFPPPDVEELTAQRLEEPTPESAGDACIIQGSGVNIRAEPSTDTAIMDVLVGAASADAQTTGMDGYIWWHLPNGWVRADVVQASGACADLPFAEAESGEVESGEAEADTDSADLQAQVLAVFAEAGYTDQDIQDFLDFNEITLDDITAEIELGNLTLEDLYDILMDE